MDIQISSPYLLIWNYDILEYEFSMQAIAKHEFTDLWIWLGVDKHFSISFFFHILIHEGQE